MSDKPKSKHPVLRRSLSVFFSIFIVLFAVAASAGFWFQRHALDSGAMASDARVFLADSAVGAKVGEFLTDAAVDVGKEVRDSSKDRKLARVLGQSLTKKKIAPHAESIATSPAVVESLAALIEKAHSEMRDILTGKVTEPTPVSLNLVPVVVSVLTEMQNQKVIPESVKLPVLAESGTPAEDIAAMGKAFKIDLKSDFAQMKIVTTDEATPDGAPNGNGQDNKNPNGNGQDNKNPNGNGQNGNGQNGDKQDGGFKFADIQGKADFISKVMLVVYVGLVLLLLLVLFVAPSRLSGFRITSVALLIAALMAATSARTAPDRIIAQVDKPEDANIIAPILDSVISSYVTMTTIVLVLVLVLVAGAFAGPRLSRTIQSRNAA